ncbi:MAG: 4-(cytidine 5'-diphospho)-2-C-methyl-D-erythritol kinase, partial [Smithellaceae bacterium]|nr:4-(cytidine 5'-diphospho)-2-C-methyl-D-erythritol kinase [Smithellaceae bacterium]
LTFQEREAGITVRCPAAPLPSDRTNLAYQAAEKMLTLVPRPRSIEITIRKGIPLAAGLGGGSSDAGTTLLALNDIFDLHLSITDLMSLGAEIGADVPFFVFGRTAWATGIGDRLQAAETVPKAWFVLINPGFPVPTGTVYKMLNLGLTKGIINYSIRRFYSVTDLAGGLHNDLERVTLRLHSELMEIKELLLREGALGTLMSGSGPTVFGIFEEEDAAEKAAHALEKIGVNRWRVYQARSL